MKEKWNKNSKQGFTIIEVVLVLAIAGLIFMMVFVALPALQRSQRNTQRRDDMARIATAIVEYQGNNRGRTPWGAEPDMAANGSSVLTKFIKRYIDPEADDDFNLPFSAASYEVSTGCSEAFMDPGGTCYGVHHIRDLSGADDDGDMTEAIYTNAGGAMDNIIYAVAHAGCSGVEGQAHYIRGVNNVALFYILDGGAITCVDNN